MEIIAIVVLGLACLVMIAQLIDIAVFYKINGHLPASAKKVQRKQQKRLAQAKRIVEKAGIPDEAQSQLRHQLTKEYPYLKQSQLDTVIETLLQFFVVCKAANGEAVRMPSKVVDAAWHAFLLDSLRYHDYCQHVFGRYLHHHPDKVSNNDNRNKQKAMSLVWQLSCRLEDINPYQPKRLPLLFAIDDLLRIRGGYRYRLPVKTRVPDIQDERERGSGGTVIEVNSFVHFDDDQSSSSDVGHDVGCGSSCGGGGD